MDEAERADAEGDDAGPDEPVRDPSALDLPPHDPPVLDPSVLDPSVLDPSALDPSALDSPAPDSPPLDSPGPDSPGPDSPGPDSRAPDDPVLDHDGPWSEEDYRTLTAKGIAHGDGRTELIDGALVVGPGPTTAGDRMIARAREAIEAALPDGLCVVGPTALRMGTDCVLVPDLVVMRAPGDPDAVPEPVVEAEEVLMIVEIVGPEHGAMDRAFKPQIYARARLPYLLLVDHHAPFAAASMVISGRYHEYARASGSESLQLEEPFRLQLPLGGH